VNLEIKKKSFCCNKRKKRGFFFLIRLKEELENKILYFKYDISIIFF
jgi:hypothetical protein